MAAGAIAFVVGFSPSRCRVVNQAALANDRRRRPAPAPRPKANCRRTRPRTPQRRLVPDGGPGPVSEPLPRGRPSQQQFRPLPSSRPPATATERRDQCRRESRDAAPGRASGTTPSRPSSAAAPPRPASAVPPTRPEAAAPAASVPADTAPSPTPEAAPVRACYRITSPSRSTTSASAISTAR